VKESIWHPSQQLVDLPDGACLFTVRVGHTLELKPWVRQWGPQVEVLAPPAFRAEIFSEVAATLRLYHTTALTDGEPERDVAHPPPEAEGGQ